MSLCNSPLLFSELNIVETADFNGAGRVNSEMTTSSSWLPSVHKSTATVVVGPGFVSCNEEG